MNHKFCAGKKIGNWLYFSEIQFNGLFKFNIQTGEVRFINTFFGYDYNTAYIHRKAILFDNKIFFIPHSGKCVHYYDLVKDELFHYDLDIDEIFRFSTAVVADDRLFFLPMCMTPFFPFVDVDGDSIKKDYRVEELYKTIKDLKCLIKRAFFYDNKIWFGICGSNQIISYDVFSGEHKTINLKLCDINAVYYSDKGFWITANNDKKIYLWKNGEIESFPCGTEYDGSSNKYFFAQVIDDGENVLVLDNEKGDIFCLKNNTFERLQLPKGFLINSSDKIKYFEYEQEGKCVLIFPVAGNSIIKIEDDIIETISVKIDTENAEYYRGVSKLIDSCRTYFNEENNWGLSRFCSYISSI